MSIKDLSLRSKMVIGGTLIVLIPLIIIGAVTYINTSRMLEDVSKVQTVQIARSLSSMVSIALEKDLKTMVNIARDPRIIEAVSGNEFGRLNATLADLYGKIGIDYEGLGVFDREGIIRADGVDRKRIGISIADREYFQEAKKSGAPIIGPPLPSKATGRPIFVLCAPIMSRENRFSGGVLAIVKADYLMRYITSLKLGKTGYAFMLDRKGYIIAHPDQKLILKNAVIIEPHAEILAKRMTRQETGTIDYTLKETEKVAGFAPVPLTGWSIGITQNRDEIMALAYTNRNYVLLVSGIFLAITILAVFFLSRTISSPVQKTIDTLSQAIEQTTEAISIIGLDRKVQFVNPAMATIIDRPMQELIGRAPILTSTDKTGMEEIWDILMQGNMWNGCITGEKRDGSHFFMNMTINPIRDDAGRIGSFLAIGRDISRELMIETQLRQSQKMEAIGTLAGGVAHDFNNMLSVIIGNTELAMQSLEPTHPLRKRLQEILNAGKRSSDLTRQLLAFARKQTAIPKVLNLNHVVSGMLKMLQRLIGEDIELVWVPGPDLWTVRIDPSQIDQILANLTVNARDAIEKTGRIVIETSHALCDEDYCTAHTECKPGEYVMLSVSDNGCGMEKEVLSHIFDPFFTTKKDGQGTGLGLAMIYGIVKQNGGFINVYSEPGKGTTFKIYLPRCQDKSLAREYDTKEMPIPEGKGTVLIVEDEEMVLGLAKSMLERLGYQVLTSRRTDEAIRLAKEHSGNIDVLLTDIVMPDMNGKELSERIIALKPGLKCLFMSGYTADVIARQGILEQGVHFISKPFSLQDLAAKVRETLDS